MPEKVVEIIEIFACNLKFICLVRMVVCTDVSALIIIPTPSTRIIGSNNGSPKKLLIPLAEAKIIIGHTRRKLGVPGPDGGSIALDGDALVQAGQEEKNNIVQTALNWGEPMGFYLG